MTWIIMVLTGEQSPAPETDGRSISKVRRVPVGRKLTSMEVFERVFCTPFATARLLRPFSWGVLAWGGEEEEEGFCGGGDGL